jgi:hypothetical protein
MTFHQWLADNNACKEALDWVGDKSLEQSWAECENGEWMAWLIFLLGTWTDACATARRACDEAVVTARRTYDGACAPAWRAYADNLRAALPNFVAAASAALEEKP